MPTVITKIRLSWLCIPRLYARIFIIFFARFPWDVLL